MSDLPAEAVQAASDAVLDRDGCGHERANPYLDHCTLCDVLAVYPILAAQVRRETAERIAAALEAVDPVEWAVAGQHAGRLAARLARQIGEADA